MKVILTKDVKAQGKMGDVINVSDGYAKNFLIPRGLAKLASEHNMADLKAHQAAEARRKIADEKVARELAEEMKTISVEIRAKAGENGKLFGSVTSADVAEALKKQGKIEIDKKKLDLREGIKTLGEHSVTAHLYANVTGEFTVWVVAE